MARPSRTALYTDDPTFLWKAILRALTILFAVVGVGTIAWALTNRIGSPESRDRTTDSYYYSYNSSYDEYYHLFATLPWTFITLGLSILWNLANLAVLFFRNKPIHPGANVGCDLVLWLGLMVTGIAATFGESDYFYYYENGSLHKGIVIAVGAAMSFMVLLFHFALFISACRYTHARRYGADSKQAKLVTAEATKIAQQMIADMTEPNGSFRPRTPQQQQQLQDLQPRSNTHGEMQQTSHPMSPQPSWQRSHRSSIVDLPPPGPSEKPYQPTAPVYMPAESSIDAANRGPPDIRIESPRQTHPALRSQRCNSWALKNIVV